MVSEAFFPLARLLGKATQTRGELPVPLPAPKALVRRSQRWVPSSPPQDSAPHAQNQKAGTWENFPRKNKCPGRLSTSRNKQQQRIISFRPEFWTLCQRFIWVISRHSEDISVLLSSSLQAPHNTYIQAMNLHSALLFWPTQFSQYLSPEKFCKQKSLYFFPHRK